MFGRAKRSFNSAWYQHREWLEYSVERDTVFCFPCRLFGSRETAFTTVGFSSWNKATERFNGHVGANSSVHNSCVVCCKNFLLAQSKGMDSLNICCDILNVVKQLGESQRHQIKENREYLSTLLDAILFLCKQELALRGHREGKTSANKGNFLELLDL